MIPKALHAAYREIAAGVGVTAPPPLTVQRSRKPTVVGGYWHPDGVKLLLGQRTGASAVQITMLHELSHELAPDDEEHGAEWRAAYCRAAEAFGLDASDLLDLSDPYDIDAVLMHRLSHGQGSRHAGLQAALGDALEPFPKLLLWQGHPWRTTPWIARLLAWVWPDTGAVARVRRA